MEARAAGLLFFLVVSLTSLSLGDVTQLDYAHLVRSASERMRAQAAWSSDGALRERVAALGAGLTRGVEGLGGQLLEQAGALLGGSSRNCSGSLQLLGQALSTGERWSLEMLDAWGKPGSGLLQGELKWLGSFQECLDVTAPGNLTTQSDQFRGQYCRAIMTPNLETPSITVDLGVCVPDTCNKSEVRLLLTTAIKQFFNQSIRVQTLCAQRELDLDSTAVVAIIILSFLGLLLLLGTVYDVVVIQRPVWRQEERQRLRGKTDSIVSHSLKIETSVDDASETTPLLERKGTPTERSLWAHLLVSFSLYTNGRKLLDSKQSADSLTAVHGIRFLSMTWVLLGHTIETAIQVISNVRSFRHEVFSRWTYMAVTNATVSVDSFFMLSGLLVAYLLTKELEKVKSASKIKWTVFYFHRFWREGSKLTPPYMLTILVSVALLKYFGEGPLWVEEGTELDCKENWWTNLLYINNFVNREHQCIGWTWYLANDMQFFLLSPLIVVPLVLRPRLGYAVTGAFLLTTVITPSLISSHYQLPPTFGTDPTGNGTNFASMDEYYVTPYCRMGPYIIGLLTGYLLQRTKCSVFIAKSVNALCWALATATCLAVVYGLWPVAQGNPLSVEVAAFYNGLHRTAWGVGVAWVVFACATGHGGFVNTLLSWKAIVPLSRLTYCCYLIHPLVLSVNIVSQKQLIHMSDSNLVYLFLANLVVTYAVSLVMSLAVEAPMLGLEKVLLKRSR